MACLPTNMEIVGGILIQYLIVNPSVGTAIYIYIHTHMGIMIWGLGQCSKHMDHQHGHTSKR